MEQQTIFQILPVRFRQLLQNSTIQLKYLQEIRLRVLQPVILKMESRESFISRQGVLTDCEDEGYCISENEMHQCMEYISRYSLYAFEEQLREGFITLKGGHRVGIAGQGFTEKGMIKGIRHISFLNIRIAREVLGCAAEMVRQMNDIRDFSSILILSPPGCGKTTLLRDMIRLLSQKGFTIGVVDERNEISASYMGVPQNQLGPRCDVLSGVPKDQGIRMLVRTMAPQIIAVDEIGRKEDAQALFHGSCSGCRIIATMHGTSLQDIQNNMEISRLIKQRVFGKIIILSKYEKAGTVEKIINMDEVNLHV